MWALRRASLPLRNRGFNVRASCIKSVSATWVEGDSGTLESSRRAYDRLLLPDTFYHSGHAFLKFAVSRRELSSQADASSTKDQDDLEDGKDESNDIKDGEESHDEFEFSDTKVEPSEKEGRGRAQSEIFKLIDSSLSTSVHVLMDKWVEEGKELSRQDLSLAMVNLRTRKLYFQALELSEWVASKRDHATHVDLIAQMPELREVEKLYQALYAASVAQTKTNAVLVRSYISAGLEEKAEYLLKKMEGENLRKNSWLGRYLLPLYANLGKADEVRRIWNVCKASPQMEVCLAAIKSFGELEKINDAEAVFEMVSKRWKLSSKSYAVMLKVYVYNNMLAKGKDLVMRMEDNGCQIGPLVWDALVKLHIQAGEVEKADTFLQKAVMQSQLKPFMISYLAIMKQYAKRGDIHNSEKILHIMRQAGYTIRLRQYHVLLQAYKIAKRPTYGIRDRIKADIIFPDRGFASPKNPASDLLDLRN